MTPTSNILPQQLGPITLPKMIRILFFIKSINAVVVKLVSRHLIILVGTLLLIMKLSKSINELGLV